jgi:peptidoglycan/xylan/chitin deacetylase (PgdA/CDA1 family)
MPVGPVTGHVLTFHSQNIAGTSGATNDHVALDECIALLRSAGIPVLRALEVVRRMRRGAFGSLPQRFACITFDDGTDFDWRDLGHPQHGPQPSMHSILRKHSLRLLGPLWLRRIPATSFVIASPEARREISSEAFHDPAMMSDDWWRAAQSSGLLDIGSHGWDHVHPAVSQVRARPGLTEAFHNVATREEAALQIERSHEFIRAKAGGRAARLFAYPYGQVSEFLAAEYLPRQHDTWAAFGTEARPWREDCDIWRLPRYVCGWNWKSSAELERILEDG